MFERFTFPNYSNTLYGCQGDLLVFDSSNLDLVLSWYLLICESLNPPLPFVTTLIWDVDFGSTEMNLKICYTKKKKKRYAIPFLLHSSDSWYSLLGWTSRIINFQLSAFFFAISIMSRLDLLSIFHFYYFAYFVFWECICTWSISLSWAFNILLISSNTTLKLALNFSPSYCLYWSQFILLP